MRLKFNQRISLLLLGVLALVWLLAACDNEPTEEPPAIPASITLKPPFISQTPQFTATLTPSQTFTPSETSEPSLTPTNEPATATATLTPTAAVRGEIVSADNLNVREGPGTEFDSVTKVAPGSAVSIFAADTNRSNELWYNIGFTDENGVEFKGWVLSRWVDDGDFSVPTIGPTPTPSPTPIFSPIPADQTDANNTTPIVAGPTVDTGTYTPFETAVPEESATPIEGTFAPSRALSDVNILAYCRNFNQRPLNPRADQTVSVYWSWWVTRPELMQQHLDYATYIVLLDGQLLSTWQDYQAEMARDPSNNNNWTVYWYVPVGQLAPGEHTVEYKVTWSQEITDGLKTFGPGTANTEETGTCSFVVTEVN